MFIQHSTQHTCIDFFLKCLISSTLEVWIACTVIGSSLFGDSIHQCHLPGGSIYQPKHSHVVRTQPRMHIGIVQSFATEQTGSVHRNGQKTVQLVLLQLHTDFRVSWPKVCRISCCKRTLSPYLFLRSKEIQTHTYSSNIAIIPFVVPQDLSGKFNQE